MIKTSGYTKKLSLQWHNWVQKKNSSATRNDEIFPLITSWITRSRASQVVDIGCGDGNCSQKIKIKYLGVDASPTLIEIATKNYGTAKKKFVVGNCNAIPVKNEFSDAAMSIWVWSHLANLDSAAQEMYRILRKKGNFLIVTANPESYRERKTFYSNYTIVGNCLRGTFELGNGKKLSNTTLYLHTKSKMLTSIKNAGFKINCVTRLGKTKLSPKGLYLAIEGRK